MTIGHLINTTMNMHATAHKVTFVIQLGMDLHIPTKVVPVSKKFSPVKFSLNGASAVQSILHYINKVCHDGLLRKLYSHENIIIPIIVSCLYAQCKVYCF
jgi:hypothetical protein